MPPVLPADSRIQIGNFYAFHVLYQCSLLTVSHSGLRVSAKCLNCKLLPEDSRFSSRRHILQQTLDFPACLLFYQQNPDWQFLCISCIIPVLSLLIVSRSGLRVSAKCLNCKLFPEDSRFISRLRIYHQTLDLPSDLKFSGPISLNLNRLFEIDRCCDAL